MTEPGSDPEDPRPDEEDDLDEDDLDLDDADDDLVGGAGGGTRRSRRWVPVVAVIVLLAIGGIIAGFVLTGGNSGEAIGPEGVPLQKVPDLAPASTTKGGEPVDGITCRTSMAQKVGEHIHVHVAIYVNGEQRRLPAGAGIAAPRSVQQFPSGVFVNNSATSCLYWLHVHSNDGILHVEAPTPDTTYTLGDFFDIWQQPLGPNQVGPATGKVVAFVNGKVFTGNPHDLPLTPQAVIQLDVGSPVVPFKAMTFDVKNLCGEGTLNCAAPTG